MRFRRGIVISLLASLFCSGGCGTVGGKLSGLFESKPGEQHQGKPKYVIRLPNQAHDLEAALEYLKKGNIKQARENLERVSESPLLNGITDEAIFRLALLYLGDDGVRVVPAQALLERLTNEFPKSIWTYQAAPLAAYLAGAKNLRDKERELKTLRELNLSLSRDNKELRQSIDRLKKLDLELEQKIRR